MSTIAQQQTSSGTTSTLISSDDAGDNTFSRANVFGLFLTLALCLLVQPYGSLLYAKPRSVLSRSVFFFWRLNPLSCILEVFLLAIAGADGVVAAVRAHRTLSEDSEGFWRHFQCTLRAITLLRAQGRLLFHDHKGATEGVTRTATDPRSVAIEDPTNAGNAIAKTITRDDNNRAIAPPFTNPPHTSADNNNAPYADDTTLESTLDITDSQYARTLMSSPVTRSPSPSDLYFETSSTAPPGSNIGWGFSLQAQHVIDLFGTIAVFIVIVKLAAVIIPLHIRIPAWFMVASWLAVQALVCASSLCERSHVDPVYVLRRAVELERRLFQPLVWVFLSLLLLLPLFGYLTHVWLLQARTISTHIPILSDGVLLIFYVLTPDSPFRIRIATKNPFHWLIIRFLTFVIVSMMSFCTFTSIMRDDQLEWPYFVQSILVGPILSWMWLIGPAVPFGRYDKGQESDRLVHFLSNITSTIFFFTEAMLAYEATGTYKPAWVEWLG
ncbi:hypothetical protein FHL15_002111 [Xylaria flabelliformis]|uniref:Uncharacterized protein n=1 Tax=Xylaria flabelliformis TaxID=2512241 RepID=A0A553I9C0_9PEZI|nr:hypothetical protein FHL15_002111 [Xylaria flabelliformis]